MAITPQTPVSKGYNHEVKREIEHRILVTAIVDRIRRSAHSELNDLMRKLGYTRLQFARFTREILVEVYENLKNQIDTEIGDLEKNGE